MAHFLKKRLGIPWALSTCAHFATIKYFDFDIFLSYAVLTLILLASIK